MINKWNIFDLIKVLFLKSMKFLEGDRSEYRIN